METELLCPACHEIFVDPVMLQCSHHLCAAHVQNFSSRERFNCPLCNDVAAVPEGGMKIDHVLRMVIEAYKLQMPNKRKSDGSAAEEEEIEEAPPATCGFCEEKPATRRCVQCAGVLCEECEKSTHSKGFFKTHSIVNIGEESFEGADFASRMVCPEHSEKLDFYCLDCRSPVCSHCLILGEHKGHQQTPLDQAYQTGKDTLGAWVEKMHSRVSSTEDLLESFRTAELELSSNAEGQRNVVNSEMDHLREVIETKRHQLLSKCAIEEKQKRLQLQAQLDRMEVARSEARALVGRSEGLLALESEHAFLAVVLALIQDMKKCATAAVDDNQRVSTAFRPLSTDAQVRSLGDLELGHPRPPPAHHIAGLVQPAVSLASSACLMPSIHGSMYGDSPHHANYVMMPGQSHGIHSPGTMQFSPPQPVHVPQVQYVYRSAAPAS
eukprot:CAMPEP_0115065966 /NCGR_PEP_ID=MMETSP0227-20121206/10548_1 /TAXON_ID=89957 /ORGANISM="Polarella glacialis, Strain CCMP 1383" /LENGTH=437 /DNA_ID=CAMNT_0002451821 /DNA_START=155 /DNA_END=1468 /DNA_ORIENTATION=-